MTTETHQVDFAIDDLADLHEVLADYAQRKGPVFEILFGGRPIWLVHDYKLVKQVIADDQYLSAPTAYQKVLGPTMGEVIATMSGAKHRHNRSAVAPVFFPKKMRQLSETVFTVEAEKLAKALKGKKQVNLVKDYVRPFTFNNIASLLGLPAKDVDLLEDWAERIMHSFISLPSAIAACEEMGVYLEPLLADRKKNPQEDVISLLAQVEVNGAGLSDAEIIGFCRNLFPAAIDTSSNTLGTALTIILNNPELKQLALQDETKEALIQEVLRWEPPLVMVPRECVNEINLGGADIKSGDDVRLCITSANNDPEVFSNPREFDPSRKNNNLAFGHGEHFCIGSHMARRVVETGVEVLLKQFPNMQLDTERTTEIVGGVLRGPKEVWVTL